MTEGGAMIRMAVRLIRQQVATGGWMTTREVAGLVMLLARMLMSTVWAGLDLVVTEMRSTCPRTAVT